MAALDLSNLSKTPASRAGVSLFCIFVCETVFYLKKSDPFCYLLCRIRGDIMAF